MAKIDLAFQLTANANGMASGVAQADRELSKVGASAKATSSEFRQAAKITAEVRTPTEKYADTVGRLDQMLQKGLLTQEVYGRAVSKAEAEMKAATSSMEGMARSAGIAERVVNGVTTAMQGIGDATKSVSDAGVSVIKFGKEIALTYAQWRLFQAVRNPAGLKDFAIGAIKGAMAARTLILAAKALGVGLALGGGAAGTAAAAVLGLSNPLIGGALLTVNLAKAFMNAKDRALEMAAGITAGTVSLKQLNAAMGAVQSQQVDDLAFAMEESAAAATRSEKAFSGFADVFVTPFVGALAAIQSGMAGFGSGISNLMEGLAGVFSPVAQAIAPVFTLVGTLVEGVLKLGGALAGAGGAVLKVAGAFLRTFLSPVIVGLTNTVNLIRSSMGSAFEYVGSRIDWVSKKVEDFYAFMAKVPIIGGAFAGGNAGGGAAAVEQAAGAMQSMATAAATVDEEMESVNQAIAQQEKHLAAAIDQATQYGQAGFDAAVAYQTELRNLEAQLQAGILNETSFAAAADAAREKFEEQTDAIRDRNKAAAEQAEEDRKAEQAQQNAITKQTDAFFEATSKASEFGEAGTKAAHEYEVGLTRLTGQLKDGRINEEQFARDAEKLKQKFDGQVDAMEKANKIDEKMAAKQEDLDKAQAEKVSALGGKSNEQLRANDIRSSEGIAQFLALATGREDPAIEENRKTNLKLEEIRKELRALQAQKVEILGAA